MNKTRYVMSWGISLQMMIFSEIMARSNTGETTPAEMVHALPAMLASSWAMNFKGNDARQAWTVVGSTPSLVLVWFADGRESEDIIEQNGTYVPNHLRCQSAFFMDVRNALDAVENYVLKGILPENTMPPGHLTTLIG